MSLNIEMLRRDFPILKQTINGHQLIYFDNAATTQKPKGVVERMMDYYYEENSNIHRGAHLLSLQATEAYEEAREVGRLFLNAQKTHEIIFTGGTTESINLVARSFAGKFLKKGDEILVSAMEHHSNIVPWQMICKEKHAHLKVIPIDQNGEIIMEEYKKLLSPKTRLVALAHVSNSLGTINPVKEMTAIAHQHDIPILIDGAQAVSHLKVDVQDIDCDFYCYSGHKMYGPMGIGVLYGKEKWLECMPPYQGGGEMIKKVTFEKTTYNDLPYKFEAGTPNVCDVLGLESAMKFLSYLRLNLIAEYEQQLMDYAMERLQKLENIRFIGTAAHKASLISFLFNDIHPYDTGTILDKFGIAVRTGNHCAQPVMDFFGIPGTVRVSFAVYNTFEEIDVLIEALKKIRLMFS
jgi:cysteine desulfurase / selenocysteine lyase